jgi:Holliday junction resolvase-like predicted endonuclease
VLVFVESLELQPILAQFLKERYQLANLPLVINGAVSGVNRQKAVNDFQSRDDGFDVMLISPKAGGVGLTLTAANNVVHLERWWNPAVEDQCNDRAYRIGQTKDVNVYTPVTKHPIPEIPSFDIVLDNILTKKRGLAESLLIPSELRPEDIADIFEKAGDYKRGGFSPLTIEESYLLETGEAFEDYVGAALYAEGFVVRRTKRSWDYGCDLLAKRGANTVLVQVKQVRSDKILTVSVEEILKAQERYKSHNPTALALITNAKKLSSAQCVLAGKNDVVILTAEEVANYGAALIGLAPTIYRMSQPADQQSDG